MRPPRLSSRAQATPNGSVRRSPFGRARTAQRTPTSSPLGSHAVLAVPSLRITPWR